MSSGAVDQNLREREKIRRKALWTLSDLLPGDPKAIPVVSMLDEIARQDEADRLLRDVAKLEDLRDLVVIEPRSSGLQIVREGSIPEPWRERFLLRASDPLGLKQALSLMILKNLLIFGRRKISA